MVFISDRGWTRTFSGSTVMDLYACPAALQAIHRGCFSTTTKTVTVIGVTGTNGKTTTCFMIWNMLKEAGFKMAFVGRAGVMGKATPKVTDLYKIPRMTVYDEKYMSFNEWKSYL